MCYLSNVFDTAAPLCVPPFSPHCGPPLRMNKQSLSCAAYAVHSQFIHTSYAAHTQFIHSSYALPAARQSSSVHVHTRTRAPTQHFTQSAALATQSGVAGHAGIAVLLSQLTLLRTVAGSRCVLTAPRHAADASSPFSQCCCSQQSLQPVLLQPAVSSASVAAASSLFSQRCCSQQSLQPASLLPASLQPASLLPASLQPARQQRVRTGSLATYLAPAVSALTAAAASGKRDGVEAVHNAPMVAIGIAFIWVGILSHACGTVLAQGVSPVATLLNTQVRAAQPAAQSAQARQAGMHAMLCSSRPAALHAFSSCMHLHLYRGALEKHSMNTTARVALAQCATMYMQPHWGAHACTCTCTGARHRSRRARL
jgi:hypothetical protein